MKIAIVGTSHLTVEEHVKAAKAINDIISEGDTVISGGAKGIDQLAVCVARDRECGIDIRLPVIDEWKGYKPRNQEIAEACDVLYCITTKTKTESCYHCVMDHQRTGGCWTMKYAKSQGKKVELIVI